MSLKDRIEKDNVRVFINTEQFATEHMWNNNMVKCVVDADERTRRNRANIVDISWDSNTNELLIHIDKDQLEIEPYARQKVLFDKRQYEIIDVYENMGMYDIMLREVSVGVIN